MKRILPKIDFLPCILLQRESKTFFQLEIELRADIWKMEYNNLKKGVFSVLKVDRMLCSKKERREEEKKRMAKVANIMKLKMRYSASSQEKKGEKERRLRKVYLVFNLNDFGCWDDRETFVNCLLRTIVRCSNDTGDHLRSETYIIR